MEPSFSADTPAFRKAVEDFGLHLALDDQDEFRHTTLEDLQRTILEIQEKHASKRRMKNMTRLRSFLEAMEQYGKVIEVFLNTSEFIAFIWVSCHLQKRKQADSRDLGSNKVPVAGIRTG